MAEDNTNEDQAEQSTENPEPEQIQAETPEPQAAPQVSANDSVSWEASEFIHHEKDWVWFGLFAVVTLVIMLIMYWILEDILSIFVIALGATALAVFANRKPRVLKYAVDVTGISIGEKTYTYDQFKGYTVAADGAVFYILLIPLGRFSPPTSMHFEEKDGDNIVSILDHYLPQSDHQPDVIDRLVRRIRF